MNSHQLIDARPHVVYSIQAVYEAFSNEIEGAEHRITQFDKGSIHPIEPSQKICRLPPC